MRRKLIVYYTLFSLCMLLLPTASPAHGQDAPTRIDITWVELDRFPEVQVYVAAYEADGSRYAGLAINTLQFFEDGSELYPGMPEYPRGTALTFLIDADHVARDHWHEIIEAIKGYVADSESWMDEDWDCVTIIVANGQQSETLVENTPWRNAVLNAFTLEGTNTPYELPVAPATPLNDLIEETLDSLAAPPRPGMYRALVVFSSGDVAGSGSSVERVAKDSALPLFTVLLGQDPTGAQVMEQLARYSGGGSYRLGDPSSLAPLWETVSSHRQQYVITYRSQINTSGSHAVKVQLSDTVQDSYAFEIAPAPPKVEITLPGPNQAIQCEPRDPSAAVMQCQPKTQDIKYLLDWSGQSERNLKTLQLRVDGAVVVQKQLEADPGNRDLIWDLTDVPAGKHSLRVEVQDELGLTGASLEVPVAIEIAGSVPPSPTPAITATPGPSLISRLQKSAKQYLGCAAFSGFSLGALLVSLFVLRRRATALKTSPIAFLRHLPVFRPINKILLSIERVVGPIRVKKPAVSRPASKEKKKEKGAWVTIVAGQTQTPGPIAITGETTFGRSQEQAQVVFAERTVSRLHARIVPEHGDRYRIYNHSNQHTWVNEQRVPQHGLLLQDGDEIRMGQVRLQFQSGKR